MLAAEKRLPPPRAKEGDSGNFGNRRRGCVLSILYPSRGRGVLRMGQDEAAGGEPGAVG